MDCMEPERTPAVATENAERLEAGDEDAALLAELDLGEEESPPPPPQEETPAAPASAPAAAAGDEDDEVRALIL